MPGYALPLIKDVVVIIVVVEDIVVVIIVEDIMAVICLNADKPEADD